MKKIIAVIRREFVERVRTKAFVISTLLLPVFMVAMVVLPGMMMSGSDRTSHIAVVDASSTGLGQPVSQALEAGKIGAGVNAKARYTVQVFPAAGNQLVKVRDDLVASTGFSSKQRKDGFDGVLVLTDDTLVSGKASYYGGNVGSMESMGKLQSGVSSALAGVRLGKSGVDAALVRQAMRPADLDTTASLAGEVGPYGVRVLCLRPDGISETWGDLSAEPVATSVRYMVDGTMLGRLPTLDQVADAAAWAASDRAAAMTGTILNLTCGSEPG